MKHLIWAAFAAILFAGATEMVGYWPQAPSARPAGSEKKPGAYQIVEISRQWTEPVGVAVSATGEIYVAEAGRARDTTPRVIRLGLDQKRNVIARDFPAPLTGLTWMGKKLLVAYVGGLAVLDPITGAHHPIITGLPTGGDHPNGPALVGPDERLYFAVGSATNAGVVGVDNVERGWLKGSPKSHDIPCQTVILRGSNFTIPNPLTDDANDRITTGAFSPFGKTTARLQEVPGAVPCTASVLSVRPDGLDMKLVAWGLRYASGLTFGPDGQLYVTVQGLENRGSRPVVGDRDYLYRIEPGQWYGWPDFAGGRPITDEEFQMASFPATPLLAKLPGQPPLPVSSFPPESDPTAILFLPESHGFRGDALVAMRDGGLYRVNPRSGHSHLISLQGTSLPLSPVQLTVGPDGGIYLLDQGEKVAHPSGYTIVPGTGRIMRLNPVGRPALATDPTTAAPPPINWQWALVGAVLSTAGISLARRTEPS